MIKSGKCPKCEQVVGTIKLEDVDASVGLGGQTWRAVNYLCPHCSTILSTAIDPVGLRTEIVAQVAKLLKGGS